MSPPLLKDIEALKRFSFERILNEDPVAHCIALLGTLPDARDPKLMTPTVVRVEKTPLPASLAPTLLDHCLSDVQLMENTNIYTWMMGWLTPSRDRADVKISIVHPATEVHIRKYTAQEVTMVRETPELYESIVRPYIDAFPPSRTQWVEDILTGKSEADKILFKEPSPDLGYIILPDMKWDLITISSLYLVAIVSSRQIRSLRDLRKTHLPMLRSIRAESARIVKERWNLSEGSIRLFVHYQPSYYHFHIHIVNANYYGLMGSTVGQAHLLDDLISLLELDHDSNGPSIFERMTLTYGLGDQHGLYIPMKEAQNINIENQTVA